MLSTSDLSAMPTIAELRDHMQRLAALEAVVGIHMEIPTFEFYPNWSNEADVAVNDNRCGDLLTIHFSTEGCLIKGFAHESEMSPYKHPEHRVWPGVLDDVPSVFESFLNEPAFEPGATTFAIWRCVSDATWSTGDIKYPACDYGDGSADLLAPLTFTASAFTEWLIEDLEVDVDEQIVQSVFAGRPLSDADLSALQRASPLQTLRSVIRETGYPLQSG